MREKDEVRFDIIYSAASEKTRRIFTVVTGIAAIVLSAIALPAVISYVLFIKVEQSAYLGIRLDYLYSIYVVFSLAVSFATRRLSGGRFAATPLNRVGSGSAL